MSIRFGAFFGQSDTFWHGIQVECDFRTLAKDRKKLAAGIKPVSIGIGEQRMNED